MFKHQVVSPSFAAKIKLLYSKIFMYLIFSIHDYFPVVFLL